LINTKKNYDDRFKQQVFDILPKIVLDRLRPKIYSIQSLMSTMQTCTARPTRSIARPLCDSRATC